ncbi:hypothetical protein, partial [Halomonas sp.]|uniref:hypothetical protein n=1 Tax=Halomonas sp. TaxID=1486246 RepID=UPI003F99604A
SEAHPRERREAVPGLGIGGASGRRSAAFRGCLFARASQSVTARYRVGFYPSPFTIHHSPFTIHHSPFTVISLGDLLRS